MEALDDESMPVHLPSPEDLRREIPRGERAAEVTLGAREAIRRLLHGEDEKRLLVVVGPCSIHDPEAALEYAARLARVAAETRDELVIVMRTYVDKPRSTRGWKGLVNDPGLDGSCDVALGLRRARSTLLAIAELGVPCGSEILDPVALPYLHDLLAWGSIGARTAESQVHRVAASGLPLPVGVKNGTDGEIEAALEALTAIGDRHAYVGIAADGRVARLVTRGNPDGHLVLRGGRRGPNASAAEMARAIALGRAAGLRRPLIVDCSHANSGKDPSRQPGVARDVLQATAAGESGVLGLMLESHLRPGRQAIDGRRLEYGVSVTDACLGWSDTEPLLYEVAAAVLGKRIASGERWSSSTPPPHPPLRGDLSPKGEVRSSPLPVGERPTA